MRLLRIQREDLPGQLGIWRDERRDGFRSEPPHGFEPMPSIWRPEAGLRRRNGDDRIKKRSCFLDHACELLMMSFGEVALKRCRLDGIDRHDGDHEWRSAQGIFPGSHDRSALLFDTAHNLPERLGGNIQLAVRCL